MNNFELTILDFIQNHIRCAFLDKLMPLISSLGNAGFIWILLTVLMLFIPKNRRAGLALGIGLVIDLVLCNLVLKPLIARVRPYDLNPLITLLIEQLSDYSFPSGHTAASFTAVSALYFSKNRLWIPALVLAVLIAFSRLYLYVHYPSDVLAGILLGAACGAAGVFISGRICSSAKPR